VVGARSLSRVVILSPPLPLAALFIQKKVHPMEFPAVMVAYYREQLFIQEHQLIDIPTASKEFFALSVAVVERELRDQASRDRIVLHDLGQLGLRITRVEAAKAVNIFLTRHKHHRTGEADREQARKKRALQRSLKEKANS
jgi:hypothetical protein